MADRSPYLDLALIEAMHVLGRWSTYSRFNEHVDPERHDIRIKEIAAAQDRLLKFMTEIEREVKPPSKEMNISKPSSLEDSMPF